MTKTVEERVQDALEMHKLGFNCSQCVALATADFAGLDQDQAFRMAEGLGGGLGGFTETCGAVNGGAMVLSYANSNGMELHNTKLATYAIVKEFVADFKEECGGTLCADLRPTDKAIIMETCSGYISTAVRLVCKHIDKAGQA